MTTPQIDDAKIAETAFYIWNEEGRPHGRDREHWFRAAALLTEAAPKAKPRRAAAKPKSEATAKPAEKTVAKAKPAKAEAAPKAARAAKPRAKKAAAKA